MKSNSNDALKRVKIHSNGYEEPSKMFFRTFSPEKGKIKNFSEYKRSVKIEKKKSKISEIFVKTIIHKKENTNKELIAIFYPTTPRIS